MEYKKVASILSFEEAKRVTIQRYLQKAEFSSKPLTYAGNVSTFLDKN